MFALAEVAVVHVRFRRNAHTFSLNEIPVVMGLFFSTPGDLAAGVVLGSGAALLLVRRNRPVKLAFNVSQLALSACVAVLVFRAILGGASALSPLGWWATAAAVMASTLIGTGLTTIVIRIYEGELEWRARLDVLAAGIVSALGNASVALVAARLLWLDRAALLLLAGPALILFFAYRSYIRDRQTSEELGHLYDASRSFQESESIDRVVASLMSKAARMFRADRVDVVLFGPEGQTALRSTLLAEEERELMLPIDPSLAAGLVTALGERDTVLMDSPGRLRRLAGPLAPESPRNGMAAAMRVESRLVGLVLLCNRPPQVGGFDAKQLKLLHTVASHAAVALVKGRLEQELHHRAFHDSLTNLANRALFSDRVEHALARAGRGTTNVAVVFVDLDDFKVVNDVRGHPAGDQLLIAVAERLRACLRPEDTAARFGGDEFVILLESVAAAAAATRVADRVLQAFRTPFSFPGFEISARASVGVAVAGAAASAEELVLEADAAMYVAKKRGKGQVVVFEESMKESLVERHSLIADLREALGRSEFVLRFQPLRRLDDGSLSAVETLVRWAHHDRGLLPPDSFIPLAEETGVIVELDLWILSEACARMAEWTRAGWGRDLSLMVNVSGRQLERPDFAARVMEALESAGLDPRRLVLEITEGVMVADLVKAAERLQPLRAYGVRLAIDDFGTGYSSLASLQHFPVDILKIAKPFVDRLDAGTHGETFVRAILRLAGALGISVVAEGVEHESQAHKLLALGCEMGQGWLLGRPVDEATLSALATAAQPHPPAVVVPLTSA